MPFNPVDEYPTLDLPIKGKIYKVPSPDAATGLWVQSLMIDATGRDVGSALVLDDNQERDVYERMLGDAYQQMLDDGVPWHTLKHAGTTALLWISFDDEMAERFWNSDSNPKAPALTPETSASEDPPA